VVLAARGARETTGGRIEAVDDPAAVRLLKSQATRVYLEALAIAVVGIAVVMLARGLLAAYEPAAYYGFE
jgi:hypothetical protein